MCRRSAECVGGVQSTLEKCRVHGWSAEYIGEVSAECVGEVQSAWEKCRVRWRCTKCVGELKSV